MIKKQLKNADETRYCSPAIQMQKIAFEGILCASGDILNGLGSTEDVTEELWNL